MHAMCTLANVVVQLASFGALDLFSYNPLATSDQSFSLIAKDKAPRVYKRTRDNRTNHHKQNPSILHPNRGVIAERLYRNFGAVLLRNRAAGMAPAQGLAVVSLLAVASLLVAATANDAATSTSSTSPAPAGWLKANATFYGGADASGTMVPCVKRGGVRFTINGHDYFNLVLVTNVAAAGSIKSMDVKSSGSDNWIPMSRNWGANWHSLAYLTGQMLSFRVTDTDGQILEFTNVVPKGWKFGQTFIPIFNNIILRDSDFLHDTSVNIRKDKA
ncbi:hypothetical protein HU200_049866 [Digitaria exilis]|uniref:Expansin n=1 Tax=Digitaria exilis TaxID=1010633 RepID=A0A835ASJ1_9POAL|nr:hypothetical protein HU200_049866 [Digitaria exilis]